MKLYGTKKTEYVDDRGITRATLVGDDFQEANTGIPLMDLSGLELPEDIEDKLVQSLQAVGIVEYADALRPGAVDLILQAWRMTLKASVKDVMTLCQNEYQMLKEAGYEHK